LDQLRFLYASSNVRLCCFVDIDTHCSSDSTRDFKQSSSENITSYKYSCQDILDSLSLKVFIWIIAVLSIFGNILVFGLRCHNKELSGQRGLFVTLAVSDFLTGIYLCLIGGADAWYTGEYAFYESQWKSGALCKVVMYLAMVSSEISITVISIIAIDRLIAVVWPFYHKQERTKLETIMHLIIGLSGLVILGLSLVPLLLDQNKMNEKPHTCIMLPLGNPENSVIEWFAIMIFIALNAILMTSISIFYCIIVIKVKSKVSAQSQNRNTTQIKVGIRCMIVIATDCLTWLIFITFALVSLGGVQLSNDVMSGITVVLLPLNSAMNPFIYTVSTEAVIGRIKAICKKPPGDVKNPT